MTGFRIAAAQVPSIHGDIASNIVTHLSAIEAAAQQKVNVLIFPELSLTGYEPELAAGLAITADDPRLHPFIELAQRHRMDISVGAPLSNGAAKPFLGAILYAPDGSVRTYRKMHLGGNEPEFFAPGTEPLAITSQGHTAGLAICADASPPSHPQRYADVGAEIYAAGVFLTVEWYATDGPRLASYATQFRMLIVMANHGASTGTYKSVGNSAVWGPDGTRLAIANGTDSALIIASHMDAGWTAEVVGLTRPSSDQ